MRRRRDLDFRDLAGLKARGYIRESTERQADKWGPAEQRRAQERFADEWDLRFDGHYYTDLISGRSTLKRSDFKRMIADADASEFRVLLVYDTSRFARNELDAYTYEHELHRLGITVVYVMERIISSNAETAAIKGMHHVMNAEYSRKLSLRIEGGLREKYEAGYANGHCPFGWSRELDQRTIRPVPDEAATVLAFSQMYASGAWSLKDLAAWANGQPAHPTRDGLPWNKQRLSDVLFNPVHDGLVVWHPGEEDEESKPGEHAEHRIRPPHLTAELARVRRDRATTARPSRAHRVYTYSGLLECVTCGSKLWGSTTTKGGRRMTHPVVKCADPSYHVVSKWDAEVEEKVIGAVMLPPTWRTRVMGLMQRTTGDADLSSRRSKLEKELEKIRSLYKVDDDYDERSYLRDRKRIQAELAALGEPEAPRDMEKAAQILGDFPRVWRGSTETTRRALLTTIFETMGIKRDKIVSVTPREQYLELVTVAMFEGLLSGGVYRGRGERT
jgi:DNA invertase Pin-like site-specific DNA recombinase